MILDSTQWILDSRSLSVELGFWTSILDRIPDSLSCIPDSKAPDFVFHKENFLGFQHLDSLTLGDIRIFVLLQWSGKAMAFQFSLVVIELM